MIRLIDFKDGLYDRVIQMALRNIDTGDLSDAMLGWNDDERQIILRNMSKRAAVLLKEDMAVKEGAVPNHRIDAAQSFYLQKLQQHLRYFAKTDEEAKEFLAAATMRRSEGQQDLPAIDLSTDEALIETFVGLSKFIKTHGILSLAGIEESVEHPIFKKALQYVIDGWDPILYQSILERMAVEYVHKVKRQLEMITTGVESIAAGDHPVGVEERLRAFLV